MDIKREKNITIFKADVRKGGGYIYTDDKNYSALMANKKQTDEIVNLILHSFPEGIKIMDIGCGDGKYTLELFKALKPKFILGIDPAEEAIKVAKKRINKENKNKIQFRVANIYNLENIAKGYQLVVLRGVLHHLYQPKKAIKMISQYFDNVVVLEPNGYNPILKVIEKTSPYHRQHEEKSYPPPLLNKWFEDNGYRRVKQNFFGIVPYFCPDKIADLLKFLEVFFENTPLLKNIVCGSNLILYKK